MSYRDNTNEVVLGFYRERGFDFTIDLCKKIMVAEEAKSMASLKDRNIVAGEICESVLEVCMLEHMRKNRDTTKDWIISKGLILKDLENPESDFLTEVDLVLFTPKTILVFECKNYMGDKVIKGQGTIHREGRKPFDVFKQHLNHCRILIQTFDVFKTQGNSTKFGYRIGAFVFSTGSMEDQRDDKMKEFFPFFEIDTVTKEFDLIHSMKSIYDMERLRKAVKIIEANKVKLASHHLHYVKSLRNGRGK